MAMATRVSTEAVERPGTWPRTLNTRQHDTALSLFMVIVLAHWLEHVVQAVQVWGLDWSRPDARGALGLAVPWLVTSEWLHYGYALIMLAGLWMLRGGFTGRSRQWWTLALGIQFWHHIEHLLLLVQVATGAHLGGGPAPSSILQLLIPRVELHLFYNAVVFVPMVVAIALHRHASETERAEMRCRCALAQPTAPPPR